jgi:hypothetical protein
MVQAFPKKWWVESDFPAPNRQLPLRLKPTYLKPRSNSRDTDSIGHTPEQRQTEHKTQETNKMSNAVPTKTPKKMLISII